MTKRQGTHFRLRKEWCKSCGICVEFCPQKILFLDTNQKVAVTDVSKCIYCKMCEDHCPDFAISIGVIGND